MAPSERKDNVLVINEKDQMFKDVQEVSSVPAAFLSLKTVERDYGLSLEVWKFRI